MAGEEESQRPLGSGHPILRLPSIGYISYPFLRPESPRQEAPISTAPFSSKRQPFDVRARRREGASGTFNILSAMTHPVLPQHGTGVNGLAQERAPRPGAWSGRLAHPFLYKASSLVRFFTRIRRLLSVAFISANCATDGKENGKS